MEENNHHLSAEEGFLLTVISYFRWRKGAVAENGGLRLKNATIMEEIHRSREKVGGTELSISYIFAVEMDCHQYHAA
jgi:hypothetical protein